MADELTLSPYVVEYLDHRRRKGDLTPQSRANARVSLRRLSESFGARPLSHLGTVAVQRFMERLGPLTPASRKNALSSVRAFSRWMVERHHLKSDPTFGIAAPRVPRRLPRALSVGQIAAIQAVLPDARARVVVAFMAQMGLRCCEVARLMVEDWDVRTQTLIVKGKGSDERCLPVPGAVTMELNALLRERGAHAGPLICSRRFGRDRDPVTAQTISRWVSGWMAEAGVKQKVGDGRSAHSLRHSCASDVMDACRDVYLVKELLGHSSVQTTTIYLRRADLGRLREAMEGRSYDGTEAAG